MLDLLSHLFAAVCGQNPGHTWAPGGMLLPCCQRCTGLYVGAGVAALLHLCLRPRLTGRFLEIHGAFLLAMAPLGLHWIAQGPALRTASGVLFGFAVVTFLWLPLSRESLQGTCPRIAPRNRRTSTSNIQQPTSNNQWSPGETPLDVGCWLLDVGCFPGRSKEPAERILGASDASKQPASSSGEKDAQIRLQFHAWRYYFVLGAALLLLPLAASGGGTPAGYVLSGLIAWGGLALLVLVAANVILGLLGVLCRLRRFAASRAPA